MRFSEHLLESQAKPEPKPTFLAEIATMSKVVDGTQHFDPAALDRAYNQNHMSRETVIHISPKQFLLLANKLSEPNPRKQETVSSALSQGKKLSDLPYLSTVTDANGNLLIDGHEGRHRMMALDELGIREVPVVLISGESGEGHAYRWGNTEDRPQTLTGQDDRITIPMPKIHTY